MTKHVLKNFSLHEENVTVLSLIYILCHFKMPSSPERVLPYTGYKGIFSPKGCRFSAVLDINRVRVLGRVLPTTTTKFFW